LVAAGLAERCEVMLSYSIGQARPVSVQVETFGSGAVPDDRLAQALLETLDLRVGGIVRRFNLRHLSARRGGFYRRLAAYGQLGRTDLGLPWEQVQDSAALRRAAGMEP
jgi:S-adenosylmethionine synthetase